MRGSRIPLAQKALCVVASFCLSTFAHAQSDSEHAQPGAPMKPVAVVALSGYDALAEDADFIGSLAGMPGVSQMAEQMILMSTENQGLAGLDKSKPIGVIVQTDGMNFSGAICLPVSDLEKLLVALQGLGVTSEDQVDGITGINAMGQSLFAKSGDGWVFLGPQPEMLEGLPEDPSKLFSPLTELYDLGIRAYVQNIPEVFRDMAVAQLEMGMDAATQRLPNESDEAFGQRKAMLDLQLKPLKQMINELDEFTLGLAIDSGQQRTFLDMAYTAVSDSDLAERISLNSNPKTNYAGFFQPDAAMMISFASKVSEADLAQMDQMFDALRKQLSTAIQEEADLESDAARDLLKAALNDFLDAIKATMKSGKFDGGAVLNLSPGAATFGDGRLRGGSWQTGKRPKKIPETGPRKTRFSGHPVEQCPAYGRQISHSQRACS